MFRVDTVVCFEDIDVSGVVAAGREKKRSLIVLRIGYITWSRVVECESTTRMVCEYEMSRCDGLRHRIPTLPFKPLSAPSLQCAACALGVVLPWSTHRRFALCLSNYQYGVIHPGPTLGPSASVW